VLSPNVLLSVDRATTTLGIGPTGWFTTVEATEALGSYNVTALVPVFRDADGGITEPRLRLAGTDYPVGLVETYTALPPGSMGPAATDLLAAIRAEVTFPAYAARDNAYDLARTMQAYLRDERNFRYQANVQAERNAQCDRISTVECFARIRVGYCDYYASTMTVLLRSAGVPARVAYGFLPGERGPDGLEVVGAGTAHYWVEVYFPGVGWIEFDPTGGNVGVPQAIPSGSVGPSTPRPSVGPGSTAPLPTGGVVNPPPPAPPPPGQSIGPFIVIGIILAVGIGALAFAAYRRSPGRPMDPDQAWGSVSRLASRFGLGPRPSQTVY
jgi:transglutaminase-like putative cysteine protease